MNKRTITTIWLAGLVGLAVGLAVAASGTGVLLALGGHFDWRGSEIVGFTPSYDGAFWTGVGLISGGGLVLLAGLITQFVAWIGALINTWQLADKLWFVLLLVLGLLRFEFVIMLIYVLAGPDGVAQRPPAGAVRNPLSPVPG